MYHCTDPKNYILQRNVFHRRHSFKLFFDDKFSFLIFALSSKFRENLRQKKKSLLRPKFKVNVIAFIVQSKDQSFINKFQSCLASILFELRQFMNTYWIIFWEIGPRTQLSHFTHRFISESTRKMGMLWWGNGKFDLLDVN